MDEVYTEITAESPLIEEYKKRFVIDGTYFFKHWNGNLLYVKRVLTVKDLLRHFHGKQGIGLKSAWEGCAKWVAVDIDTLDRDNQAKAVHLIEGMIGCPCYPVFSGKKGFHIYIMLDQPTSTDYVGKFVRKLDAKLRESNINFNLIAPLGKGVGISAPLGLHRETGARLNFLNEQFEPVSDPLSWMQQMQTFHIDDAIGTSFNNNSTTAPDTQKSEFREFQYELHFRLCINRIYKEGLQRAGTRHSATLTIANAIGVNANIPTKDKWEFLEDWVRRVQPTAAAKGFTSTNLEYWLSEAKRILQVECKRVGYGVTCKNPLFRPAMESACDEMTCAQAINRGNQKYDLPLLKRLGIFSPSNARKPGIGPSKLFVYEGLIELEDTFEGKFTYSDRPGFAAPFSMLQELTSKSKKTICIALKDLQAVGLAIRVPPEKVPPQIRQVRPPGRKQFREPSYYILPELTEAYIKETVLPKARNLKKKEKKK